MQNRLIIFEDGLLDACRELAPSARTVTTWPGDIEDALEWIKQRSLPAILSIYAGGEFDRPADAASDEDAAWELLVAVKDLRGDREALRGTDGRPGAYDLVYALRAGLAGRRIPNDAAMPLEVPRRRLAGIAEGIAIYQLSLSVRLSPEMEE